MAKKMIRSVKKPVAKYDEHGYNVEMVKKILKLREGPFIRVPSDPVGFRKWLDEQ